MKTARKIVLGVVAMASTCFIGCDYKKEPSAEEVRIADLEKRAIEENQKFQASRDSLEQLFVQTLDEIDQNLDEINTKQGIIELGKTNGIEHSITAKKEIIRSINAINSLMEENQKKITALNNSLKKSKMKNSVLQKLSNEAAERLKLVEAELTALKGTLAIKETKIAELNGKVGDLETKYKSSEELAGKLDMDLNVGYYTYGKYKDLEKKGLVEKRGMLGVIKPKKVNGNFASDAFTKIDIREATSILINSRDAKLMTNHPAGSYEFKAIDKMIASLEIKNPQEFWKASKYMVLEVR